MFDFFLDGILVITHRPSTYTSTRHNILIIPHLDYLRGHRVVRGPFHPLLRLRKVRHQVDDAGFVSTVMIGAARPVKACLYLKPIIKITIRWRGGLISSSRIAGTSIFFDFSADSNLAAFLSLRRWQRRWETVCIEEWFLVHYFL